MARSLSLLLFLSLVLSGCAGLNASKNFPKGERQKFIVKFCYFQNNGFGGYFRMQKDVDSVKGKWKGKLLVLFLPNVPAEYPQIVSEFHELPDDWKAGNFSEVDTLVLLEFRGGVQEKLLNQEPKDLRLVMRIIDTKKKRLLRTIKLKSWPPGTDRKAQLRKLPSIKEALEQRRKKS